MPPLPIKIFQQPVSAFDCLLAENQFHEYEEMPLANSSSFRTRILIQTFQHPSAQITLYELTQQLPKSCIKRFTISLHHRLHHLNIIQS